MVTPHPPAAHLSPAAQAFLRNAPPPPEACDYSDLAVVTALRSEIDPIWAAEAAKLDMAWVNREEFYGGVRCLRYASTEAALDKTSVLVHFHGGSYIFGSPEANAALAIPVAVHAGVPVVSVDYRRAPEHRCPAAIHDAVAVVCALAVDHDVIGMYGESAGGGLAVSTAVALRDAGHAMPERIGLLSPWVDLTISGDSHQTLIEADPDFGDPADPPALSAAYAGDDTANPQASPLFAELSGLPPVLTQVGSREILLSDACRLDQALRRSGVDSTLDIWDGLWHIWQLFPELPESGQALREMADFLTGR